jgi:hypothetical protein
LTENGVGKAKAAVVVRAKERSRRFPSQDERRLVVDQELKVGNDERRCARVEESERESQSHALREGVASGSHDL